MGEAALRLGRCLSLAGSLRCRLGCGALARLILFYFFPSKEVTELKSLHIINKGFLFVFAVSALVVGAGLAAGLAEVLTFHVSVTGGAEPDYGSLRQRRLKD